MKHIAKLLSLSVLVLIMAGCGDSESSSNRVNNGNSVDKVLSDQIDNAQAENGNVQSEIADTKEEAGTTASSNSIGNTVAVGSSDVDYDLTAMGSDMVYAMVYQLMVNPDDYIGKTFRVDGLYTAVYYEPTSNYYHYCIIPDATSCCTQGLEFVWDDGNHVYPDEYPEEYAEVVIQGTFETYREDGDENLYCRLNDATMNVGSN